MAETDKKIEAMEQEVSEAVNPQADAPKKNAVAAEPSHIAKMASHEDLGKAVTKPTDSNPCLLYTSPSPRDRQKSRMPSSA